MNVILLDFFNAFMVKIEAKAVIINRKKGRANIEFKF